MPAPVPSLIPTAATVRERIGEADPQVPMVLWQVLSTITDPRARRGRRHDLATVLVLSLAAVLSGACCLAAITDWVNDRPRWCWARLGVHRRKPRGSTIRRVAVSTRLGPTVPRLEVAPPCCRWVRAWASR